MHTHATVLMIGKADGTIREIPARYNGSHQRGYRFFTGPLAHSPEQIMHDTPPSFEGRRLFDALAEYRKSIEPAGWRLLHAAARRDCWPKPDELFAFVQRLTRGVEHTERVDGFESAKFNDVATLAEQEACFEEWKRSLAPVFAPRAPRRGGHEHDEPVVDFGPLARLAAEYFALGRSDTEAVRRKVAQQPHPRKRG